MFKYVGQLCVFVSASGVCKERRRGVKDAECIADWCQPRLSVRQRFVSPHWRYCFVAFFMSVVGAVGDFDL